MIEQLLGVLWLAGLIARAAEAGSVIWWPWPWAWERQPSQSVLIMPIGLWLIWQALKWAAILLIIWPVRGLIVLIGWSLWQARLYRQEHYSDNVVPLRRR